MTEEEQAKLLILGSITEQYPGKVEHIKARSQEMRQEFIDKMRAIEDEEERGMELIAFSLFLLDGENMIDEI